METANVASNDHSLLVYPARHAAENLTGCRVEYDAKDPTAHMALPSGEVASLGHLAVLIDVVTGQAVKRQVDNTKYATRTVSLQAHLAGSLIAGQWVRGVGKVFSTGFDNILAGCEIYSSSGTLVAVGTCRFVKVRGEAGDTTAASREILNRCEVPDTWSSALGLARPSESSGGLMHRAAPNLQGANLAGVMHGGLQTRLLDVAMRNLFSVSDPPALVDLAMFYQRPVPLCPPPNNRASNRTFHFGD